MVKLNINLDESLKAFADEQVAKGRYQSTDHLIAELLRDRSQGMDGGYSVQRDFGDDQPEALRKLIQEGLDSGPSATLQSQEFEMIRQRVRGRQHRG